LPEADLAQARPPRPKATGWLRPTGAANPALPGEINATTLLRQRSSPRA
jgi:hypothetical protein